mgnify:CR=1 FL=1
MNKTEKEKLFEAYIKFCQLNQDLPKELFMEELHKWSWLSGYDTPEKGTKKLLGFISDNLEELVAFWIDSDTKQIMKTHTKEFQNSMRQN